VVLRRCRGGRLHEVDAHPRSRADSRAPSVAATRTMQRGHPVRRRCPVVAHLPLRTQLRHREQLVLDSPKVLVLDRVTLPDAPRRQAPRADPSTDCLGIPAYSISSLGHGQHAHDGTPVCGPNTRSALPCSKEAPTRAARRSALRRRTPRPAGARASWASHRRDSRRRREPRARSRQGSRAVA
jgi:hypothetical protein